VKACTSAGSRDLLPIEPAEAREVVLAAWDRATNLRPSLRPFRPLIVLVDTDAVRHWTSQWKIQWGVLVSGGIRRGKRVKCVGAKGSPILNFERAVWPHRLELHRATFDAATLEQRAAMILYAAARVSSIGPNFTLEHSRVPNRERNVETVTGVKIADLNAIYERTLI
jgi:hypothetical protein